MNLIKPWLDLCRHDPDLFIPIMKRLGIRIMVKKKTRIRFIYKSDILTFLNKITGKSYDQKKVFALTQKKDFPIIDGQRNRSKCSIPEAFYAITMIMIREGKFPWWIAHFNMVDGNTRLKKPKSILLDGQILLGNNLIKGRATITFL